MKTLLLCPELFARESGIQRILRLYLKALCDGAKPTDQIRLVVLNDRELPAAALQRYAGQNLTRRRACGGSRTAFLWHSLRAAFGVDRIVCGHIGQLVVARLANQIYLAPDYFLVAHGIEVWRDYSVREQRALQGARRILCVSEFTRREMLKHVDVDDERITVVPNALDPFFEAPAPAVPPHGGDPVILAVARLDAAERYKGVDHLIAALPAVRRAVPGARLRVIGAGDDLPRLKQMAATTGIAGAVEFSGFVDDSALRTAYAACTLFALPSRGEGFGLVYLEAMAHGKPCLGADAGAVPEIIDASSGVLAGFGDVSRIAEKLVWALQQEWNAAEIRRRAAQFNYPAFQQRLRAAMYD